MTTVDESNWTDDASPDDYPAARDYLHLLLPEADVVDVLAELRTAPIMRWKARDLLRASGLGALPADDPDVVPKLKKLKKGVRLSPVLLLRGDLQPNVRLTVADGYHRICASYLLDAKAEIPCKLVNLPDRDASGPSA